jgi:hypothetical protein
MNLLIILVLAIVSAIVVAGIDLLINKLKERKVKNHVIIDFSDFERDRYYSLVKRYRERLEKLGVDFMSDPASPLFALMTLVRNAARDYVEIKDKPEVDLEDYIDVNLIGQFVSWLIISKVQIKEDSKENKVVTEYFYNLTKKIIADKNPEKLGDFEEIINKINEIVKFK